MADREKAKEERGVDSVTDYVEEKEMTGDTEKIKQGLTDVTTSTNSSSQTLILNMSDIEYLSEECCIEKPRAEILLRKMNGNVKEAMLSYLHGTRY